MFEFFIFERPGSRVLMLLCLGLALAGCASTRPETQPASITVQPLRQVISGSAVPAHVRYDRYTVISTRPRIDQFELLDQIIDLRIPDILTPSLHQAMTYALRHSGYQLCPAAGDVGLLFAHPLPASHYRLGPMSLLTALQLLAGPAWELQVDELDRQICFVIRPPFERPSSAASSGGR
jgi:type IV pili sensor histidine kinase/response regulator